MSSVSRAYFYYLQRVFANRLRGIGQRLKKPRYLIGFALAAVYLWFFLVRPLNLGREEIGDASGIRAVAQAFYLLQFATAWLFGALGRGILFRESEVELLFPAPLSRPQILFFKFLQTQFAILVTAIVFGLLVGRSLSDRPFLMLTFAIWLSGTVMQVHATWATLTLKSIAGRGGIARVLAWLPGLALLGLIMALVWQASVEVDGLADLKRIVDIGALRTFLTPFRFIADFILVATGLKFFLAALVQVAALAIFSALLVASDHRFEDQALKTARQLSRLKQEGASGLDSPDKQVMKATAGTFPRLQKTGPLWRALVWKNVLSVGRVRRNSLRILLVILPFLVMLFVSLREDFTASKGMAGLSFICLTVAFYGSLLGPALIRVDLRLDIPHFDVLKSLPIRGRELLLGEVLGPTFIVFALQIVLVTLGLAIFPDGIVDELTWRHRIMAFVISLPFFFAFDFTMFSLENLMALHLPSFVRFGRGMKGGFDQFGQNLLGAVVRALVLMVLVMPAVLVGGTLGFLLVATSLVSLEVSIFIGIILASAVLIAVAYSLLVYSEKRYEEFDLSSESLSTD